MKKSRKKATEFQPTFLKVESESYDPLFWNIPSVKRDVSFLNIVFIVNRLRKKGEKIKVSENNIKYKLSFCLGWLVG